MHYLQVQLFNFFYICIVFDHFLMLDVHRQCQLINIHELSHTDSDATNSPSSVPYLLP